MSRARRIVRGGSRLRRRIMAEPASAEEICRAAGVTQEDLKVVTEVFQSLGYDVASIPKLVGRNDRDGAEPPASERPGRRAVGRARKPAAPQRKTARK